LNKDKLVIMLGAGAMGAAYASRFYECNPEGIAFVASGERYERLNTNGVVVNGHHFAIPVLSPADSSPPADLIMVALKHQHLAEALPILENFIGDNTVILSIMNGLDSEPMIAAVYGEDRVLYATAVGIDAQRDGNVINYSKGGTIFFGEADNRALTPRVMTIQAIFDKARIAHQTPEDMLRIMWWKFMINVGINQASAIIGAPYGTFQTSPHAQQIMETAMWEVLLIAKAAGVNLVESDIQEWYTFMNTLDPAGKTSMLQDIEAGRKTEVEIFSGKVIALGKKFDLPTPVNEVLFHAIKVIEQKNLA
jgi:2-dehydropantoate 2-reductase